MYYSTRYILRIDDICPSMDRKTWSSIETIINNYQITPIVAIIPQNLDPVLNQEKDNPDFWFSVAEWQKKKWCIALHGYQHIVNTHCGGLTPIMNQSEFAGLPFCSQFNKIKNGLHIFTEHDIYPQAWVSPFHSYDEITISALNKQKSSIKIICDGLGIAPYCKDGFLWIPSQLWKFIQMPFGTWTCCIHPSQLNSHGLHLLETFISNTRSRFISIDEIITIFSKRRKNILDFFFERLFFILLRIKRL